MNLPGVARFNIVIPSISSQYMGNPSEMYLDEIHLEELQLEKP